MEQLQLPLEKQWFEMTKAGIKSEDYREITPYWVKRLFRNTDKDVLPDIIKGLQEGRDIEWAGSFHLHFLKHFDFNIMTLGYPSKTDTSRILKLEHKGIEIRTGNPDWGAEPNKLYFVIKHGKIITP